LPALDGCITPWDNLSYDFLGKVVQGQSTNIVMPHEAFNMITTWGHMQEYMADHLADLITAVSPLFPSVVLNEDDTIEITMRNMM
jgi:hypothetical protein